MKKYFTKENLVLFIIAEVFGTLPMCSLLVSCIIHGYFGFCLTLLLSIIIISFNMVVICEGMKPEDYS